MLMCFAGRWLTHCALCSLQRAPVPGNGDNGAQGQPQALLERAERLNNQLERLVMDNYHVFVQNINCSSIVSDQVGALCFMGFMCLV